MIIRRKTFENLNNNYVDLQIEYRELQEQFDIAKEQLAYYKMQVKKLEENNVKKPKASRTKKSTKTEEK